MLGFYYFNKEELQKSCYVIFLQKSDTQNDQKGKEAT